MRGKRKSIEKNERRYDLMEKCTDLLTEYLEGRRDINKCVFNIVGTIYRGVSNNRFTLDQALTKLWKR